MLKKLGEKLFTFYCHPDFQEDIKGDLEEYYLFHLEERGQAYANRKYLIDVMLLFRLSLLRDNWMSQQLTNIAMVKSNLKVAYRSMMRHKFYTFLNLSGLAISIAACILIAVYVQHELSYDRYHQDAERTYRIATYLKFGDNEFRFPASPAPMAQTLKNDFPEILAAGRHRGDFGVLLEHDNQFFNQEHITYADQELFEVLTFNVLLGDPDHLLDEPNTVVLPETTAAKYFGTENPIGKTLRYNGQIDLKVTGVIEDFPENSSFKPEMMITMLNDRGSKSKIWLSNNYITYLKLDENNDSQALYEKLPGFYETYFAADVEQFTGGTLEQMLSSGSVLDYQFQPISRIHLYSSQDYGFASAGSIQYVYIFSIVGLFILLIACINFMNLATARASVRAKEVGVRKVLGSLRKQLISQFITEAILSSLIAFIAAIALVHAVLPYFNHLTDKEIVNPVFGANQLWIFLLIASLLVGWLAGIYPAYVLSKFTPVKVLKGETTRGKSGSVMRNVLVVIQFVTSIFLIICSSGVYSQLSYLQNKELGFNKDQVFIIPMTAEAEANAQAMKNQIEGIAGVESVSVSGYIPAANVASDYPYLRSDATSSDEAVSMQSWQVDLDYANTYELELVKGRFFDEKLASDSLAVVINETAAKRFGYGEDALGKKIKMMAGLAGNTMPNYTIIGVVKDFHYQNMLEIIQPQGLFLNNDTGVISVKFSSEQAFAVVEATEQIWAELTNGQPFEIEFMSDMFSRQFRSESRVKTIFTIFASLAIVIACLGLFGLSAYLTEQRKKEIGIRKVLGASVISLLGLFFGTFNRLILIAAVLAVPLAYFFMQDWLSDFTYQTKLSMLIFILGAVGTLIIAWLTVGFQSLKAARRNPVDNLRYE